MKTVFAFALSAFFLLGAGCAAVSTPSPRPSPAPVPMPPDDAVFCTQDAKLCPDGSYVARHGPNCEFDPCPGQSTK